MSADASAEVRPVQTSRPSRPAFASQAAYRVLVTLVVVAALVGLLVAGATVKTVVAVKVLPTTGPLGGYPAASLSSPEASVWACPGPLPAGGRQPRSSIEIVNAGASPASLAVEGAAITPSGDGGSPMSGWAKSATLAAHSSLTLPLPTTGPAQSDAVSVVSSASSIAVFEVVSPVAPHAGGSLDPAALQSPCELGTTRTSYIPSGSTTNKSTEVVAVYNPTATEAVVGMTVASTSSSVSPPELQGLTIKPYSLQTYSVGTWVVQHSTVAITLTATVGQVAVGVLDTQSASGSTGQSLEIGDNQLATVWTFTPGVMVLGRSVAIRVYDPTTRPTTILVSSPVAGGAQIDLTASVAAEGAETIELPAAVSARPKAGGAPIVEGPIVVRTAEGVGVAVARGGTAAIASRLTAVGTVAITAASPEEQWLLPDGGSAGEAIVVANPGSAAATVKIYGLLPGGGSLIGVTELILPGQARKTYVELGPYGALFVTSSQPVVVDGGSEAVEGRTRVPAAASPVEAIPVVG